MDSATEKRRFFPLLLAACAVASIVPLFMARHLPMSDLPEHLATMATLRHWGDAGWANQEHFQIAGIGETPYWLYHVAGALLSVVTGSAERANLVLLALVGLGYPYALRSLLRALGRDERLAIFGCALFWTQNLTVGLLNFVASVPLVLFGLALVAHQTERATWRRGIGLAALAVAIFYLHLSAFVLFVAQAGLLVWLLPAPPAAVGIRRELTARLHTLPRRLGWLAPAFACALVVSSAGRAGAAGSAVDRGIRFTPRLELLRMLPHWLFDNFRTKTDDVLGWAMVAILAFLVIAGRRSTSFEERWRSRCVQGLFGVAVLVYFVMPTQVGAYAMLLDLRMSVFVALFAVLLPRPRLDFFRGALPLALAGALSLAASINVTHEVRAFEQEEVGSFDEILRQLPQGKRLLSLNFEPRSRRVNVNPFHYFGSYYRARYGGVASFSFNEIPHWPVQYRADQRPPGQPANGVAWGNPCMFRNARDGMYFDFILVHGDRDPIAEGPAGPSWELVGSSRAFHLYRRVAGEVRSGDEDHSLCL